MTSCSTRAVIVFHGSDPDERHRLRLDEEVRGIERELRASEFRDSLDFRTRWATRADDLLDTLNRDSPAVVHFAGHGSGPDGLVFHGENGVDVSVSGEVLKDVFATAGPELRLVLLNACFSHEQAPSVQDYDG